MISFEPKFISIGANKVTNGADWNIYGQVAFAAGNFVALFKPFDEKNYGITATLPGHKDVVNGVKFLKFGPHQGKVLISYSQDKTIRIWKLNSQNKWVTTCILKGHKGNIESVAIIADKVNPNNLLITSSATDSTIKVWNYVLNDSEKVEEIKESIQTIDTSYKKFFSLTLDMSYLPNSNKIIMAAGGTNLVIDIYILNSNNFDKILSLQGHTDWVRCVEFAKMVNDPNTLILASSSQDKYIRIWKISETLDIKSSNTDDLLKKNNFSSKDILESFSLNNLNTDGIQLSTKAHIFEVNEDDSNKKNFTLLLDAVLMGHDNWVYSVKWKRISSDSFEPVYEMVLLSASADNTMILWIPDSELNGVWNSTIRVGELGSESNGFIGGLFSPEKDAILAHSFTGAFYLWEKSQNNIWEPKVTITGHFGPVEQVRWDPSSNYIISVSKDQTARLFMQHVKTQNWYEVARPQIHGYDMRCLTFLNNHKYICGADEKVLRVIQAPLSFVKTFNKFKGIDYMEIDDNQEDRPISASLPSLGLSNKAVSQPDTNTQLLEGIDSPPIENYLCNYTLWPEIQKLYGHVYEIMYVTTTHDFRIAASVNKAAKPEHATIRLWNTKTWKEYPKPLTGHTLTITSLAFSSDDVYLVSVGRDRSWSLYKKTENEEEPYKLVGHNSKAHARIIWDCSWTPDNKYFATASRDKTLKIWKIGEEEPVNKWIVSTLKLKESITAVQFLDINASYYVLALGLESGKINIMKCEKNDLKLNGSTWTEFAIINENDMHVASVKSIEWRKTQDNKLSFVTCSTDGSIRIFEGMLE
ncbi:WD40 repeat-like protein [Neocallimastix californiae]|uniref:Elongator complex protein 2 n=1 Tax=Neocallimastix californiae TaxID=1754190 RepID=A0A1Y2BYC8_9FUNG|nr:WD40 repeat-like protein [Neocallimastix californiae]|eukprot:ORY39773.1 WD40 repeat-like protein [Neocallimastix californiae]